MPSPLDLSSAEQDWLAEVCIKAAEVRRQYDTKSADESEICQAVGEWFAQHVIDGNLQRSQCFSVLYDKLHRSGSNA